MKVDVLDLQGNKVKKIDLPSQFNEPYHPDLIKRAVIAVRSTKQQPYGTYKEAGKRPSLSTTKRRHVFKATYGHGISRVPRKIMSGKGARFFWVGAFAPGTVKGRKAHPPKSEKILVKNINKKERRKAIRSALAATLNKYLVSLRNHQFKEFPLIVDSKLESLSKTKEVISILKNLGLEKELERTNKTKVRAGKGKRRGRKLKSRKGPLIVVSTNCKLEKTAKNIPGIDIVKVNFLNAELLAPGTVAGRLTIYTDKSIEKMEKENLFI